MHKPYEERLQHKADFRVRYRFYDEQEGGRKTIPFQGYRSDFWYGHENSYGSTLFMIWPEFEDEQCNVILANNAPVAKSGTARMWIIDPQRRTYHKDKIKLGTKGFFMEGSRRVAECEVIELLDMPSNPTT